MPWIIFNNKSTRAITAVAAISLALFGFGKVIGSNFEKTKIAVLDFELQGENFETQDLGKIVAEWFITSFVKVGRFDVVERSLLKKVVDEQAFSKTAVVDNTTATKIGKILGVKIIISGSVMKFNNQTEINARIIDVETASIIAAENVSSFNTNSSSLQEMVVQMSEKILRNFPLTGYIVNKSGNTVKIDLGTQIGIKNDMIFNVYEEGNVIKHPKTGEVLDVEKIHIGKIIVTNVSQKISDAEIIEEDPINTIKYGHKVQYTREERGKSKGKLNVETTPDDAIIRILNIVPPYRAGMELPYGKYLVEISATGYQTVKDWIIINSPGLNEVSYTLTQLQSEERDKAETQDKVFAKNVEIQEDELKPSRHIPQDIVLSNADGPLFTDKGNGVIVDNVTGLIWTKRDSFLTLRKCLAWKESETYLSNLRVGGYDDWRLPTLFELDTLYSKAHKNKDRKQNVINLPSVFSSGCATRFFSSETTKYDDETFVLTIRFDTGEIDRHGPTDCDRRYSILAVRGKIQKPRFVLMQQSVVVDNLNMKMWTYIDNIKDIDWNEAKEYCESLSLNGYSDWRMPSIEELKRISSSFFVLSSRYYWSSTCQKSKAKVFIFYQEEDNEFWEKIHENENMRVLAIRDM